MHCLFVFEREDSPGLDLAGLVRNAGFADLFEGAAEGSFEWNCEGKLCEDVELNTGY